MTEETGDIKHHKEPRHRKEDHKKPKRWVKRAGAAVSLLAAGIGGGHQARASAAEVASQVTEARPAAHTRVLTAQETQRDPLADVRKGLATAHEQSSGEEQKAFEAILEANDVAPQDLAPKLNDTQLWVAVHQAKTEGTLVDAKLSHQTIWHQYKAAGMTDAQADLACRLAARASEHDQALNKDGKRFSEYKMQTGDTFDAANPGVLQVTSAIGQMTPEQIATVVKSLPPEQQVDFLKIARVPNRDYDTMPREEQLVGDRAALEVVLEGAHRYHKAKDPRVKDFLLQLHKAKTPQEQAQVVTKASNNDMVRLFLGTENPSSGTEEATDTGATALNDRGHLPTEDSGGTSTGDTSNVANGKTTDVLGVRQIDVPSFADKAKMLGQDVLEKTEDILKIVGKGALGLGGALLTLEVFGWALRKDRRMRHRRQEEHRRDTPAGWGPRAERRVNPDDPEAHLVVQRVRDYEQDTAQRQATAQKEYELALLDAARKEAEKSSARRRDAAGEPPAAPAPEPPPLPPVGEPPAAPAPEPPPLRPVGEPPAAPAPEPSPLRPVGEPPAAPAPEQDRTTLHPYKASLKELAAIIRNRKQLSSLLEEEVPDTLEKPTEIQIATLLREHPFMGEMDPTLPGNETARYVQISTSEDMAQLNKIVESLGIVDIDEASLQVLLDALEPSKKRGDDVSFMVAMVRDAEDKKLTLQFKVVETVPDTLPSGIPVGGQAGLEAGGSETQQNPHIIEIGDREPGDINVELAQNPYQEAIDGSSKNSSARMVHITGREAMVDFLAKAGITNNSDVLSVVNSPVARSTKFEPTFELAYVQAAGALVPQLRIVNVTT